MKALLFVPKRVTREIVFLSKTQSCFHIYSIKTISNGLHIVKGVIRGEPLIVSKRVIKEIVFIPKHRVYF